MGLAILRHENRGHWLLAQIHARAPDLGAAGVALDVLTCGLGVQNHHDIIAAAAAVVHRTAQNAPGRPVGRSGHERA